MSHSFNSNTQQPSLTSLIKQQLTNVASFLAPQPQQPYYSYPTPPNPLPSNVSGDVSMSSYDGLKKDLAELGDTLKTSLSLLLPNKAVTGMSKLANRFIQLDKGVDLDRVVGISDDVVGFVREVSVRPQCWVDFPLSLQDKDFSMSQVQKDHAFAIQDLVPNLATLRHSIHNFMNEQRFWMIYFILLVPRLNEDDCRLLLTPEILQMHEELLQKLRNKKNTPIATEDDALDMVNMTKNKNRDNDVCFSDVEHEEFKQTQSSRVSSASENSDWVRIGANRSRYRGRRSESEESSSDWHAIDDVDL